MSLADGSAVTYLCSTPYAPGREFGTDPFDAELGLPWPADITPVLSEKDAGAPTLREAQSQELLPEYAACLERYAALRA
jgi:dTDP-4-dehydrorhamnose 3,5-epimerase